jgi:predicted nucleic acid-binding protein
MVIVHARFVNSIGASMNLIVDTSIWIDFFKGKEPFRSQLQEKLELFQVIGLSWVFGEILQGARNSKEISIITDYWSLVKKVPEENIWIDAGIYASKHSLIAKGIGLIDSAILTAALRHKVKIWTHDKKLHAMASKENLI